MRTEIVAGLTTFFAMACILVVNPAGAGCTFCFAGRHGVCLADSQRRFFATCLIAFPGTFLMAVYAKVPFAQALGMELNAFFAYTVVPGKDIAVRKRWR